KVYDLFAIRIITQSQPNKEISDCWHVFSIVTNFYKPEIRRLRDWISRPRENGYESLHITVEAFENQVVEVQIRSERMDDEAENGMAAHWRYKGGRSDSAVNDFMLRIRQAIERKETMEGASLNDRILKDLYVFTPTGELKKLRQGATVLDFAFAIHSEVGIRCSGAKVNGKVRPIKHQLTNGDRVEIFTSKTQKPAMDWLNFVTSNKAKAHIRRVLDERRKQEMEDGKELLMRRLRNWKMDFSQEVIDLLVHHFKVKQAGDIYVDIYRGKIDPAIIKKLINPASQDEKSTEKESSAEKTIRANKSDALIVDDIDRVNYKLSGCCNPVPGDKIFGFVTVSKGISIHRFDCSNATSMFERFPYRILPAQWKSSSEDNLDFRAQIFLRGNDRAGVLAEITKLVSSHANLLKVNLTSKGTVFQGKIEVGIKEKEQLQNLLKKLQALTDILEVYRVKS
ncbi:MAG: bifunctional (p)ppGpp synthetase/guanosine-3',5'-bis(diphosphate) 3'-pyrophosphohydrolase, partial [Bacteroidales bacterium]|nr:bifunctional (p)ppGpp synthetase/guanosine-3',5'-bis(diphosphate) 3'-pyrophosphohydrolase [Bacteroidales bacterium]